MLGNKSHLRKIEPGAMETRFSYFISGTHCISGSLQSGKYLNLLICVKPSQAVQLSPDDFKEDKDLSDVVEKF